MREGCKLSSVEGPLVQSDDFTMLFVLRISVPSFSDYLFLQAVQELSQHYDTGVPCSTNNRNFPIEC